MDTLVKKKSKRDAAWVSADPNAFYAQMAESVDAAVSNTAVARRVGSSPTPGTRHKIKI